MSAAAIRRETAEMRNYQPYGGYLVRSTLPDKHIYRVELRGNGRFVGRCTDYPTLLAPARSSTLALRAIEDLVLEHDENRTF